MSQETFVPGMTERVEEARRYEQRRLDLQYAFTDNPELKNVYDAVVQTYPNQQRRFHDGSYEISVVLLPRNSDASRHA